MAGEWQARILRDFCRKPNGGIQTGPFGSQLHRADYVDAGVPVVMPTNIRAGRLAEDGIARVSEAKAEELKRHRVQLGDIIFSRRGEVDKCAVVTEREIGWLCGTGCLLARVDPKLADARFIGYHISLPETRAWLQQNAVGLVMPNLNTGILESIPIHAPSRIEQEQIADLLASLDAKVDLNRQMASTLDVMAQALFKSWFVDFDPVHAKAEGRDTGLPNDIAALLPDGFGDAGMPVGWSKLPFKAALDLTKGNSYKSADLQPSDNALVTLKSFKRGGGYRWDGLKPFVGTYKPSQEVQPGDLIIAVTDVTQAAEIVGQTAIVAKNQKFEHFIASLDVMIARPKYLDPWFWGHLLKAQQFTELAKNYTTGTTVLHLSNKVFDDFEFCVPHQDSMLPMFRDCVRPIVEKAQVLEQDCSTLEQLRDTLLPKLLSGELRLADAESVIAAA